MVASITVLGSGLAAGSAPFDGGYFMSLANESYYVAGGEPPGRWYGEGAAALRLGGVVESAAFKNVLAGLRPDGREFRGKGRSGRREKPLSKRVAERAAANAERVPGYDLTFSAPKSVSALWAAAPVEERRQIETAFDIAVRTTLDWFERRVPLARRGRGGCYQQLADLVIAQFDHATSRVAKGKGFEPQLHRHCVIANICRGQDGRWAGVNSRALHEWTRTLGPMFRATLAAELQARLGLAIERPLDAQGRPASWFEVGGVPQNLCHKWSSRRDEIEQLLEGTKGGFGAWSRAQAREAANLASRSTKTRIPPRHDLLAAWREEASRFGLSPAQATRLVGVPPTVDKETVFESCWEQTAKTLDQSHSSFTFRDAAQRVCEAAQVHGVSGAWLADRLSQHLAQSPEIRLVGEVSGETRYATQSMWKMEEKLLAEFDKLRAARGAVVKPKVIDKVIAARPELLPEQREAARRLLGSGEAIRALSGVAGAGKSFTLDVVREALEKSGYRVIGGALAAVAKEELAAKAGIESRTVASYLHHFNKSFTERFRDRVCHDARQLVRAMQGKPTYLPSKVTIDRKTILIVDEAGMIDARTMRDLCRTVRERGGTIVFVGDTAQLQPIGAGGPFCHLVDKLTPARLTTNMRQRDEADRQATEQLRRGDAKPALQNYADRGRLAVAKDRGAAIEQLVKAWSQAGGTASPEQHVVFTPTRAEAHVANRYCQAERLARGDVDGGKTVRHGDDRLYVGDRVLFHKNRFADGIRNGYRGVVTGVDRFRGRVTIRLDGAAREATIRLRDYGSEGVTLGYAQTTHKGQGQTVDHAYLLVGGKLADREMIYVQATRGKLSTQLFVDETHAGEDLQELARALARSRPKELAHDQAARATRMPPLSLERNG